MNRYKCLIVCFIMVLFCFILVSCNENNLSDNSNSNDSTTPSIN